MPEQITVTSTAREQTAAIFQEPIAGAGHGDLQRELPPESIRGRLLANRFLPETLSSSSPFGTRYLADDIARNETVCLELLPRRALAAWAEVRAAALRVSELGDPNIARIVAHGVACGAWPFWVTEHTGAPTLRDELRAEGCFNLPRVARIGARCASALAAAHGVGVLHGALAPDRISLVAQSPLALASISGFGLARVVEASGDALFGSPPELYPYVSPEHARGERLEPRSDIYSLGAILYELATGKPPFEGNATAVLRQHRRSEAVLPSRRSGSDELAFRAFDKIMMRCLAKRPGQRYAGATELAADLARLDAALARLRPSTPPAAAESAAASATSPQRAQRSGPRVAGAPNRRAAAEVSPARRPPKARGDLPAVPKVIVRGG